MKKLTSGNSVQQSVGGLKASGKSINVETRRVPGISSRVHKVTNTDNGKFVTIVEHNDGTFNARNWRDEEIHDGEDSPGFLENIFRSLFGLW